MLLQLARIGLLNIPVLINAAVKASVGRLIHIRQQQSLTSGRPVVKPRAAVTMTANANLKVKRTVDTILLCPEDGRQMLSHGFSKPKFPSKTKPKSCGNKSNEGHRKGGQGFEAGAAKMRMKQQFDDEA